MPVMLLADMNAILDPLDQGVRVWPSGCKGQLPPDYFTPDWEGQPAMLTCERRDQTMSWLQENGLEDASPGGGHTTYFKSRYALRPEDAELPAGASRTATKSVAGPAHQRRQQVVTARIDGVFLNEGARQLFEVVSTGGGMEAEEVVHTTNQRWRELELQGLGSDHIPIPCCELTTT